MSLQIRTLLLEDRGLLVQLIGLIRNIFRLLHILEHGRDVILHLHLDTLDFANESGCLIDRLDIAVFLAEPGENWFGCFVEGVGQCRFGLFAQSWDVVGICFGEHLCGDTGGVAKTGDYCQGCKCGGLVLGMGVCVCVWRWMKMRK